MLPLLLAMGLTAVPLPRATAVVFPPASSDPELHTLGLVLQARIAETLRATGAFNELHAKQLLAMAGNEAFDPAKLGTDKAFDADVSDYLGGDVFVSLKLEKGSLTGAIGVRGKPPTDMKPIPLAGLTVAALDAATIEVSKRVAAAADRKGLTFTVVPGPKSDEALMPFARCYATLVKQPLGIEHPVQLDAGALSAAIADCRKALELDEGFAAARHALALGLAIEGNDAEASKLLAQDTEPDSSLWWVARFWLVTRYQSGEKGEGLLEDATMKRPGFLLAHIYLCEHLAVMGKFDRALPACEKAASKTPKAVFPQLRVGKMMARQFRHEDAIKITKAAIAAVPKKLESREAHLQLASRYVDASMLSEAIAELEPLVKSDKVRGEELLRLGYAWQLKGDEAKALPLYEQAIAKATRPSEWRTRGRAWYDIALVQARAGANGKAKDALTESWKTGYRQQVDLELKSIAREVERQPMTKDPKATVAVSPTAPRELTLFPIDPSGEFQTAAPRPPAPPEFTGIQF